MVQYLYPHLINLHMNGANSKIIFNDGNTTFSSENNNRTRIIGYNNLKHIKMLHHIVHHQFYFHFKTPI